MYAWSVRQVLPAISNLVAGGSSVAFGRICRELLRLDLTTPAGRQLVLPHRKRVAVAGI
jgi:hypothetical protein